MASTSSSSSGDGGGGGSSVGFVVGQCRREKGTEGLAGITEEADDRQKTDNEAQMRLF